MYAIPFPFITRLDDWKESVEREFQTKIPLHKMIFAFNATADQVNAWIMGGRVVRCMSICVASCVTGGRNYKRGIKCTNPFLFFLTLDGRSEFGERKRVRVFPGSHGILSRRL